MDEEIRTLMAYVEGGETGTATGRSVTSSNLDAMRGGGEGAEVDEGAGEE